MKKVLERGISLVVVACLIGGSVTTGSMMKKTSVAPVYAEDEEVSELTFSAESGTYPEAFDVTLSCVEEGAQIYYTMDGSDPRDEANAARITYANGIHVADRKGDANVLSAIDPILFDGVNVKVDRDRTAFVSTIEPPSDDAVDKCTVIKAVAKKDSGEYTDVMTNTYFIGNMADHIDGIQESCEAAGKKLSVLSLSMDANDLFDSQKGIYVKGDVFEGELEKYLEENSTIPRAKAVDISRGMDANYKQKGKEWERAVHVDYFESDGTQTSCELQQDCGIRIQGNYSRSDYQKSFRLYAREDYGKKNFKYAFWDQAKDDSGEVIDKYKKIVLRNGGNCAFTTKFSDAYWQSMMDGIDCDHLNARPCVVYLNGEYWGVYILQDDFCNNYFQNKHGVEKDDVILYKGDAEAYHIGYKLDEGEFPEGVEDEGYYYQEIEDFMKTHEDLSTQADYDAFAALVDPDSVLDFFATEVWINNKWDWPGKNWSMWKTTKVDPENPYADGRWRYLIYDVEFGGVSGYDDTEANTVNNSKLLVTGTNEEESENRDKPNVRCFALFMTNPDFRYRFYQRVEGFSQTIFEQEHALEVAEQFKNVYQPILQQFFDRFPTMWGSTNKTADMVINGNGGDTYATWINIVNFIKGRAGRKSRADEVTDITTWIKEQFGDSTDPTVLPTVAPSQAPSGEVIPSADPFPAGEDLTTEMPGAQEPSEGNASETPVPSEGASAEGNLATESTSSPVPTGIVASSGAVTAAPETLAPASTEAPASGGKKQVKEKKLSDGAVKITTTDADGNTLSVRFRVDGILYELKADKTFCYLADAANKKAVKKKVSITISDTVKAGGKKYKVTEIDKGAFQGLKKLTKVTVGKNVTEIGDKTWYNCTNLKEICLKTKNLNRVGVQMIGGISKKAVITCPKSKVKSYKKLFIGMTGFKKATMQIKAS